MRFVVGPDDALVPDIDARAEGRGVWLTLGANAVTEAQRRQAFAKSLKMAVIVPPDLADLTRQRLEQRLTGALGMARKAGQIVTGAAKVRNALAKGEAIALFTATDAAADGRSRFANVVKAINHATREAGEGGPGLPHLEVLEAGQMGLALGMENVVHAALTNGAAAQSALVRAQRLARYNAN